MAQTKAASVNRINMLHMYRLVRNKLNLITYDLTAMDACVKSANLTGIN